MIHDQVQRGVTLTMLNISSGIDFLEAFGRWVEAIALLEAARAWNAFNVVTFSEVISNCEQGCAHQQTLVLLNQMERLTVLEAKKRSNLHVPGLSSFPDTRCP